MKEHLERDDFTPHEIWMFWMTTIMIGGIGFLVALVEMGMTWWWGYPLMLLTGAVGVGIADFKEWYQEDYLKRRQIFRQEEALRVIDEGANETD